MVHKTRVYNSKCPQCGYTVNREYDAKSKWGLKYGRCPKCGYIFKTGKVLYSDVSQEERDNDRKEFLQFSSIIIPVFAISLLVAISTGWELVGVLAFLSGLGMLVLFTSYFYRRGLTLSKYKYLQNRDPELYRLEYEESLKIMGSQSITEIEAEISSALEHKILRYCGCLVLSALASEVILMLILGDSVQGSTALLLLSVIAIPISILLFILFSKKRK